MRSGLLILTAVFFLANARCADPADQRPVDPMLWAPPEGTPQVKPLFNLDDPATLAKVRAAIAVDLEKRALLPEFGAELSEVTAGSKAYQLGLQLGEIITKLDDTPIRDYEQFTNLRIDKPQKITVYNKLNGLREIEIPSGKLGIRMSNFSRENPLHLTGDLKDERWAEFMTMVSVAHKDNPALAEAALGKAISAGYVPDGWTYRALVILQMADYRYDEMMRFSWHMLKEFPDHALASDAFLNAALSNYKLEAAADFLRAHPKHRLHDKLPYLEELVKAHKALPDEKRLMIPPLSAMTGMFMDDLTFRAEQFYDHKASSDGKKLTAEFGPPEDFEPILNKHNGSYNVKPGLNMLRGFTPLVKNGYVYCDFTMKLTEPATDTQWLNVFEVGFSPYDERRGKNVQDQMADAEHRLGLSITPGRINYLRQLNPSRGLGVLSGYWSALGHERVNDADYRHRIIIAVMDGNVEMVLDDQRIYYGPKGTDSDLFVYMQNVGVSVTIYKFDAFEVLTTAERDARVVPQINKGYRDGLTRMHNAARNYSLEGIHQLMDLGASLELKNEYGFTPLEYTLLTGGDTKNIRDAGGKVTFRAACGIDEELALQMIKGEKPPEKDEPFSALHFAARTQHYRLINALLDKGWDINKTAAISHKQGTPLNIAIFAKQLDTATLLLSRGADPSIKNYHGMTPLDMARWYGFADGVKLLEDWQKGIKTPFAPKPNPGAAVKPPKAPLEEF